MYYYNFVLGNNRNIYPDTFLLTPCPLEKYSQAMPRETGKNLNTMYKRGHRDSLCGESRAVMCKQCLERHIKFHHLEK